MSFKVVVFFMIDPRVSCFYFFKTLSYFLGGGKRVFFFEIMGLGTEFFIPGKHTALHIIGLLKAIGGAGQITGMS